MIDLVKIFDYAKEELWRDVLGYEGLYQVSHAGKVRSMNYNRKGKVQELKQKKHKDGYYQVKLCKNGEQKTKIVHRLVAEAFILNPDNKPCIEHIDKNKRNNHVNNLQYATMKEIYNNELIVDKFYIYDYQIEESWEVNK